MEAVVLEVGFMFGSIKVLVVFIEVLGVFFVALVTLAVTLGLCYLTNLFYQPGKISLPP